MSYLHRTKTHLSLAELDYSQEEKVLKVGRRTLSLDSAWVETQSPWSLVPFDGPNQLEQASVCLNPHTKPLGTPGFHEWMGRVAADNAHFEEVRAGTVEVMRSVLVRLEPSTEMPETEAGAPFNFAMAITPNAHAHLYTFGDCACLGPNPEGAWVDSDDWPEGYCEYDWHNTPADAQVWSLLAGLGHLARLASAQAK